MYYSIVAQSREYFNKTKWPRGYDHVDAWELLTCRFGSPTMSDLVRRDFFFESIIVRFRGTEPHVS